MCFYKSLCTKKYGLVIYCPSHPQMPAWRHRGGGEFGNFTFHDCSPYTRLSSNRLCLLNVNKFPSQIGKNLPILLGISLNPRFPYQIFHIFWRLHNSNSLFKICLNFSSPYRYRLCTVLIDTFCSRAISRNFKSPCKCSTTTSLCS